MGIARIDVAEFVLEHVLGDVGHRAGQLDARRPAANDHKIQQLAMLREVPFALGQLEGRKQPAADFGRIFDRLESGGDVLPLGVAEVAVRGTGRHDKRVEGISLPPFELSRSTRRRRVEARDVAHQHFAIRLPLETCRSGAAMFAGESSPVATWYNSG